MNESTKVALERAGFEHGPVHYGDDAIHYVRDKQIELGEEEAILVQDSVHVNGLESHVSLHVTDEQIPRILAALATPTATDEDLATTLSILRWALTQGVGSHGLVERISHLRKGPTTAAVVLMKGDREAQLDRVQEVLHEELWLQTLLSDDERFNIENNAMARLHADAVFTPIPAAPVTLTGAKKTHPMIEHYQEIMADYDSDEVENGVRNFLSLCLEAQKEDEDMRRLRNRKDDTLTDAQRTLLDWCLGLANQCINTHPCTATHKDIGELRQVLLARSTPPEPSREERVIANVPAAPEDDTFTDAQLRRVAKEICGTFRGWSVSGRLYEADLGGYTVNVINRIRNRKDGE